MLIYFDIEMTGVGVIWHGREIKMSLLDMLTLKRYLISRWRYQIELVYKSEARGEVSIQEFTHGAICRT